MFSLAQHEKTEHWHDRTRLFINELDSLPKGKIVFLGNSITEGFDLKKYFPDSFPINRGISGDHTDGLHLNDAGYDLLANILRKYGLS